MNHYRPLRLAVLCAALLAAACSQNPPERAAGAADPVDRVFWGGPIYTGVDNAPTAEAVAIEDGRIAAIGPYAAIEKMIGPDTDIIDLNGAALFPGFVDAHAHLLGIGMRELTLNLEGVASAEELADIVASAAQETPPGATIFGRGWIETGWPEGRFPNRDDLDPAALGHPVILIRADGHALVANSAALDAAGVDEATPDPDGGRIERDANGRATGMLIDAAQNLVADLIDQPSPDQIREAYRIGGEVYAAYGWTGLHNMSVDPDDVAVMEGLSAKGALNIRVYNALDVAGLSMLEQDGARANDNARILTRAVKLYIDGALGSRGAALSEPYADRPDTDGLLMMSHDEALAIFERALNAGVQVCTHAIGDRGNRLTLDWYEEAFAALPEVRDLRWRIEHAQVLHGEDISRFAQLGVIPSMQPSHAIGDLFFAPARLGPDRLDGAYAWRSLINAGAIIAGGSDAPVERGDPLIEFYAAVARRGLDGTQTDEWRPEQAVTRAQTLKMFTLWPAYASFQETDLGVIELGKKADFTVFSKDLMTIPEAEILTAKAVMTIVDGDIVYRAAE